MAGALEDLRHATASSPGSLEARQHALQGVALARGRHMSEVYALKQKNLQVRQSSSMILGTPFGQGQEGLRGDGTNLWMIQGRSSRRH